MDVQTPTEIEELSLRTPRPVAIYLCESDSNTVLSVRKRQQQQQQQQQQHTTVPAQFKIRTQLRHGEIARRLLES
ncbi:hypothetical protein ACQKII_12045 [Lysinibacillus sp. NPDC048646]|uniref:hypothetical protein n=1 Tax=Lysinibacillus sp. NPDC048646 TaxID=3390574 RepID=UPI003CFE72F1